jgi:RNA 2',3'-cyclic 3'-phosphodiesterase
VTAGRQRLFVAVALDPALAAALAPLFMALQRRIAAGAPRARLTWVEPGRVHLTLRFIGEVDGTAAAVIQAALAPPLTVAPFEMTISGLGVFPPRGAPRVVWARISEGQASLHDAASEVNARLRSAGLAGEDRPFAPHLTLARIRVPAGLRPDALFEGFEGEVIGRQRVDAITLVESTLSPRGPSYRSVQQTPLAGG